MKLRFVSFIPAIVWFFLINVLLLIPGSDLPQEPFWEEIYFDKWIHIGLFGGLTFLLSIPLFKSIKYTSKLIFQITVACSLYGILMEFVQEYFTTDRAFDISDMIADAMGCIIAYYFVKWIKRKYY